MQANPRIVVSGWAVHTGRDISCSSRKASRQRRAGW
jgi:hypothetical protein